MKIVASFPFIVAIRTQKKVFLFARIRLFYDFDSRQARGISFKIDTVLFCAVTLKLFFYRSQTFSTLFDGWAAVGDFYVLCRRCVEVLASREIRFELSKVTLIGQLLIQFFFNFFAFAGFGGAMRSTSTISLVTMNCA